MMPSNRKIYNYFWTGPPQALLLNPLTQREHQTVLGEVLHSQSHLTCGHFQHTMSDMCCSLIQWTAYKKASTKGDTGSAANTVWHQIQVNLDNVCLWTPFSVFGTHFENKHKMEMTFWLNCVIIFGAPRPRLGGGVFEGRTDDGRTTDDMISTTLRQLFSPD